MKVITLWQPWAQLIAHEEKKIETRSWKVPDALLGQRIAIHAAASMPKWVRALCPKFAELLRIKEYNGSWLYYLEHGIGPFGKIVATAKLKACYKMKSLRPVNRDGEIVQIAFLEAGNQLIEVCGNELAFGDYTPGRWAWILEDIQPLPEPVPAKGKQRLWNWEGF